MEKQRFMEEHLALYLPELSQLTNQTVERTDLVSILETSRIARRSRKVSRTETWRVEIPFSERSSPRFRKLLEEMEAANGSPVHLWTPGTSFCGIMKPVPLRSLDFEFDFELNDSAVFGFLTEDLWDEAKVEWFQDGEGRRILDLEVAGCHWGHLRY